MEKTGAEQSIVTFPILTWNGKFRAKFKTPLMGLRQHANIILKHPSHHQIDLTFNLFKPT